MIGPNKGSDENLRWAFGKRERSIETSKQKWIDRRTAAVPMLSLKCEAGNRRRLDFTEILRVNSTFLETSH